MEHLSKQQESFCDNAGIVGVMLSLTCLFQHLYFMIPGMITIGMIGIYALTIASFVLLIRKSPAALILLFASGIFLLAIESFMILTLTYSLVVVLLLMYTAAITALLYVSLDLQKNLRRRAMAKKEEEGLWKGKI